MSTPDSGGSARSSLTSGDLVVAALVGLVVVAFLPQVYAPRWTPRTLLYMAAMPWGVLALWNLGRCRDRAALIAWALIGAAIVSASMSPAPWRSILPATYQHESVVVLAAGLGVWAIVRRRSAEGRRAVELTFIGAVLVSVLVGVIQVIADVQTGPLAMVGSRASGLSLNPVYLGALGAAAAAWCVATRLDRSPALDRRLSALALAGSSLGVWISGSRIALLALIAVVAMAVVRARRCSVWAAVVPVLAGVVAGELVQLGRRALSGASARGAAQRLDGGQVGEGFGVRLEMWRFDLAAIVRRPLLGHGLGGHAGAVQPHYSPEFVVRTDPDDLLNNWTDAHNIIIELLVTLGVVGLSLAVAFVVVQRRSLRGPAAWAVGAASATWLLQPISMVALIPVLAMLGAAAGAAPIDSRRPLSTAARAGVVVLGAGLAVWLAVAGVLLQRAEDERTIAASELAATWWWHDPVAAHEAAVLGLREAVVDEEADDRDAVLALARSMTDREPQMAFWWVQRGDIERIFDRDDAARRSYERALEIQPWSEAAIRSLLDLELEPERAAELGDRLERLDAEETAEAADA